MNSCITPDTKSRRLSAYARPICQNPETYRGSPSLIFVACLSIAALTGCSTGRAEVSVIPEFFRRSSGVTRPEPTATVASRQQRPVAAATA